LIGTICPQQWTSLTWWRGRAVFTLHAAVGFVADEARLTGSALLRRVKVDRTFVTSGAVEAVVTGTLWRCGIDG